MLYERLDRRRAETAQRLQEVLHDETVGTPQALTERDVAAGIYTDRLAALRAAEHGLAFGRLDTEDGEVRYVGRLGLLDEDDEYNSLLMDWRAPAARPFYTATAASPEGMRRRRHLRTRRREVTGIDDEILDLDAARAAGAAQASGLTSEAALLAALGASRTGRMADIVATIQAEQDEIIRSKPSRRAGRAGRARHRQDRGRAAPGRVPALHPPRPAGPARRARRRAQPHVPALHRAGAAVAGRDERRAQHRRAALPGSGRATARAAGGRRGQGPGGDGGRDRRGGARPAAAAAADRCSWSSSSRRCASTATSSTPPAPGPAAPAGRTTPPSGSSTRRPIRLLAEQVARSIVPGGRRLLDAGDLADIRDELKESRELARELDALWPTLSAEQLLGDLYADPRRLAAATRRPARRRPRAAGPAAARRRRARGPALDARRRAAARRGRRAARRRRRRGRRPRGRGAARGGHVRPGRARRARPGGGPRPGAAARHRRHRRRPARRAPGRAPLRLHGRAGRRRPRVDLRARDRRRGAGALGDGVAAGHAPLPDAVDDAGRRHRADRRPGGRRVVGRGARAVRGEPVAAGRAHGQLPHARGDRRGGRRPARRDRARPDPAAVGAQHRACRRGPSRWSPERSTRRSRRSRPRRRAPWARAAPPCWPRPPAWRACATG